MRTHKGWKFKDIVQMLVALFYKPNLGFCVQWKKTQQSGFTVTNQIYLICLITNQIEEEWVCRFVWKLMYSCQICAAFSLTQTHMHTHSPCSTPLSSWSAVGYWMSSQNKHNLHRDSKRWEWEEKGKAQREMSVSIARSPKCSGWFPVGPH